MSSMSMTNQRRQIWSNQHPIRKQYSLIDNCNNNYSTFTTTSNTYLNSTIFNSNNNNNLIRSDQRSRYSLLQKQFSVDQLYKNHQNHKNTNNCGLINSNRINSSSLTRYGRYNNHNINKLTLNYNYNKQQTTTNNQNHSSTSSLSSSRSCNSSSTISATATTDLGIFLASKKKTFQKEQNLELKKENKPIGNSDQHQHHHYNFTATKSSTLKNPGDDKVNLNIFLGQNVTDFIDDVDTNNGDDSDNDSSSEISSIIELEESKPKIIIQKTQQTQPQPLQNKPQSATVPVPVGTTATATVRRKPLSAATRRAQFQASHDHYTNNNSINCGSSTIISASPSLIIESRPPLVRAMSAPIRQLDENSKNILANKRKTTRRRKLLTNRTTTNNNSCDNPTNNQQFIDNCGGDEFHKTNKKILNRNNTTTGIGGTGTTTLNTNDVVTLVSLISSDGSDSEKEEILQNHIEKSPIKRAPTLRKTGKSVSFQENDLPNFHSIPRDFPQMLRRGSVAPLAARIRANRPPTAPPVSIYLTDFEQHHSTKMSDKIKSASKEELSTINTNSTTLHKHNNSINNNNENENINNVTSTILDQYQYPDYVRSIKERECWKLFQKMCNKGVTVTYDTVLRGMLTPTELRQLLKQKEIEEETQKLQELTNELPTGTLTTITMKNETKSNKQQQQQ